MTKEDKKIIKDYENLKKRIKEYNFKYYNGIPTDISDFEYDIIFKTLNDYESTYGDLLYTKDSPTNTVGANEISEFPKEKHTIKMYSLDNTYSVSGLSTFLNKVNDTKFLVQEKIDGVSLSLVYKKGKLEKAITRGDGDTGDNIINNVLKFSNVPMQLPFSLDIIIRGEVVINKKDFKLINDKQLKDKNEPFKNPRNLTAGTLKTLDSNVVIQRNPKFIAYNIANFYDFNVITELEVIQKLKLLGFSVPKTNDILKLNKVNLDGEIKNYNNMKNKYPYETDGLVFKANTKAKQEELGYTNRVPLFSIAYKFETDTGITTLNNVDWSVGRNGLITPVAEFDTVLLNGSNVSRASLYNLGEIRRLGIKLNDTITISKAGEIIPKVLNVNLDYRDPKKVVDIKIPAFCPCCHEKTTIESDFLICKNKLCKDQVIKKIEYFASKKVMNISDLSSKTIEKLYENNFFKYGLPFELYEIPNRLSELSSLDGFGAKKIKNLLDELEKSKLQSQTNFLISLGINGVGASLSKQLIKKYKTVEKVVSLDRSELFDNDNISSTICDNFERYFSDELNMLNFKKLNEIIKSKNVTFDIGKLDNLNFAITGTLSKPRNEIVMLIEQNGGNVLNSVTKKCDYLITNDTNTNTSKFEKAIKNNVTIINEEQFYNLIFPLNI